MMMLRGGTCRERRGCIENVIQEMWRMWPTSNLSVMGGELNVNSIIIYIYA